MRNAPDDREIESDEWQHKSFWLSLAFVERLLICHSEVCSESGPFLFYSQPPHIRQHATRRRDGA